MAETPTGERAALDFCQVETPRRRRLDVSRPFYAYVSCIQPCCLNQFKGSRSGPSKDIVDVDCLCTSSSDVRRIFPGFESRIFWDFRP